MKKFLFPIITVFTTIALAGCGDNYPSSNQNQVFKMSSQAEYIYTGINYKWQSAFGGNLETFIYYDRNTHVEYAETVNAAPGDKAGEYSSWASFYPVYGSDGKPEIYKAGN